MGLTPEEVMEFKKAFKPKSKRRLIFSDDERKFRRRESKRKFIRKYYKDNPILKLAINSRYRKNVRNAIPKWEIDVLWAEMEWRTAHPGMTLDHIVPITSPLLATLGGKPLDHTQHARFVGPLFPVVFGFHTVANWQPLSKSANSSKRNRDWPCSPWQS